jgi:hypothetical protein
MTDDDIPTYMLPATETCRTCGDVWVDESGVPFTEWSGFHALCAPAPCRFCGQETNTPDACFDCYHGPFGIGAQLEREAEGIYY